MKKLFVLILLALTLPLLVALAPNPQDAPCDPAVACFDVRLRPDNLIADFYLDGVFVVGGVNSARVTGAPGVGHSFQIRNIQEPGVAEFGDVYNYPDQGVTQQTNAGWIWRVTFYPPKNYLKGTLRYVCSPNNYAATDSLACRPTIDGVTQADLPPGGVGTYFLTSGAHAIHTDLVGDSAVNWSTTVRDDVVNVIAASTTYLTAAFPRKGQLNISLYPAGLVADIYVDGVLIASQSSGVSLFVGAGIAHVVEARAVNDPAAAGRYAYKDYSRNASASAGRGSTVSLRPTKVWLTGTLNVTCILSRKSVSEDAACEVKADGVTLGTVAASGRGSFTLGIGAHSLSVAPVGASASRWDGVQSTVNIFGGSTAYYTARLSLKPTAANNPPPVVTVGSAGATPGGFELGGQVDSFSYPDKMKYAGMMWVKRQIWWSPGASLDAAGMINDAHAKGFKILIALVGDHSHIVGGANYDSYAAFAGQVAALGADAIEVWNEPNLDRSWPQGEIDPAKYVDLLRRAYIQIKAHNPNTMVISAAPSPTGAEGAFGLDRVWNDDRYIRGMAAAGAGRYADCIGVHYNEGIISPLQTSGDPRDGYYTRYYGPMVAVYYNAFGGQKKLCFTELGYLTPEGYPPLPGFFGWAGNVTVAQQAQWLGEVVSLARTSVSVRMIIVFNVDLTSYGDDPQAGFAIIRPGGNCPACETLHNVTGGR